MSLIVLEKVKVARRKNFKTIEEKVARKLRYRQKKKHEEEKIGDITV